MKIIEVPCVCGGRAGCVLCNGTGQQRKVACARCGGTGKEGRRCPDCRGQGWRELDQPANDLWF